MLDFEIIREILRLGAVERVPVDPSRSPVLKAKGVGLVTPYLEQLCLVELLKGQVLVFGQDGGRWIGYALTERGRSLAGDPEGLRGAVASLIGGGASEVSRSLKDLLEEARARPLRPSYRDMLLARLNEMAVCMDHDCYLAVMAHAGVILEILLKEILSEHGLDHDDGASVGSLLRRIKESQDQVYLDPGLTSIASIINQSRIRSVHHQEAVPIPSRDQTIMVIYAVRDLLRRHLGRLG